MRFIRPLVIVILLYLFALLQVSFLPHFAIAGQVPNLVFILFFILVFFEEDYLFWYAALAGFLLDVFFFPHIGIAIAALYIVWGMHTASTYFLKVNHERYFTLHFIVSFVASVVVYTVVLSAVSLFFHFTSAVTWTFLIGMAYDCIGAIVGFFVFSEFIKRQDDHSQLKLF
jgi:rod shape-determining protein MreD